MSKSKVMVTEFSVKLDKQSNQATAWGVKSFGITQAEFIRRATVAYAESKGWKFDPNLEKKDKHE